MTKLVEVALPLEAISAAARRDKDKKTGTIKNVHKWFAPMPTPAWRALLFATLIDDPGDETKRAELLRFVERLVPPDGNPPDAATLAEAHAMLMEATDGNPPTVFDPFCGGGSTLVEAQRLGLPCAGSDLNPVPVLITRTLTELLPQVAGRPPLVAEAGTLGMTGGQLDGFLADCRRYAQRIRDEVWDQIGHLYPAPPGGGTVIAWLWARTVICPNPACRATAPLLSSFWLSKKKGALTWIEPADLRPGNPVSFEVHSGDAGPPPATKVGRGGTFRCAVCQESIPEAHVKTEGMAGRLGTQLMAVAVDGEGGRKYLSPSAVTEPPAVGRPAEAPGVELPDETRAFWCKLYGVRTYADAFTNRQLVTLGAFSDSVKQVSAWVRADGGDAIQATAIASVLGLCVSKLSQASSAQVRWNVRSTGSSKAEPAFSRHALPMVWDFVETNPSFGGSVGDWMRQLASASTAARSLPRQSEPSRTFRSDARVAGKQLDTPALIATDPPYFAQIGYADLSDYFYVWLRRALASVHPDLFQTLATPKSDELIAAPHRHEGSLAGATRWFVEGFTDAFHDLSQASADLPILIVYAHRQEETEGTEGLTSTGWDAMLSAIIAGGLRVVGTWPVHGTRDARQIGLGTNALASYMVLVCRPKEEAAKATDRQGFLGALHAELPKAIRKMQEGDISTIDLGPAAIGPGMAVFSRFSRVIEPTGKAMSVSGALTLIATVTGEVLDEFVGDLDGETRWAMGWFRDHGFESGSYDDAEKLFKTTVTSLEGLEKAGVATGAKNKVRLLDRSELPTDWDPSADRRVTVWEVTQQLVRLLAIDGEQAAADLLGRCRRWADSARDLAQWLAAAALESRPAEALDHDALVTSWSELQRLADRPRDGQLESGL